MHTLLFLDGPAARADSFARSRSRLALWGVLALAALCLAATARAAQPKPEEFDRMVKLAPFVVQGRQLAVSIHARNSRDHRYAEEFAVAVLKVAHESVTESTGKGLVIIGAKGEPHPIHEFRRFLALAAAGKLDPALAARAPELDESLKQWEHSADGTKVSGEKDDTKVDLEFEKIVTALPLPLRGIGAKLYQLAWAEKFDAAKIEAKLCALRAGDLDRDLFAKFDWVFYLPPKNAFDQALDELIAAELKQEEAGFLARATVKTVMLAVKPKIRRAIEALRRGLLFSTIVHARTAYSDEQCSTLMDAFVNAQFSDEGSGTDHDRAVRAVRAKVESFQRSAVSDQP